MKICTDNSDLNELRVNSSTNYEYETAKDAATAFFALDEAEQKEFVHNFYMLLNINDQQAVRQEVTNDSEKLKILQDLTLEYTDLYKVEIIDKLLAEKAKLEMQRAKQIEDIKGQVEEQPSVVPELNATKEEDDMA